MATNPKYPRPEGEYRDLHPKIPVPKGGRRWWPLLIIFAAAAILVTLVYWLPRAPHRAVPPPSAAQVPPQPTGNQVQVSNLTMSTPTPGGAMDLDGRVFNHGQTAINGIVVEATFRNITGQALKTVRVPMAALYAHDVTKPLAENPIPPQHYRDFRLNFSRVPEGWNRNLPELRLVQVTAQAAGQ